MFHVFFVLLTWSETPQNHSEVDATWLAMSENKHKIRQISKEHWVVLRTLSCVI